MKKIKYIGLFFVFALVSFIGVNAQNDNVQSSALSETQVEDNGVTYYLKPVNNSFYYIYKKTEEKSNSLRVINYSYNNKSGCVSDTNLTSMNYACSTVVNDTTYADNSTEYPTVIHYYKSGKLSSKDQYVRNSNKTIKERRVYNYSGKVITKYTRYYGGYNFKTDKVVYNKTYIVDRNSKNKITSVANYELSQLWNEKKANVRKSLVTYSYYANGRTKSKKTYIKSVATNRFTKSISETYRSNGKKYQKSYKLYYNTSSNKVSRAYYYKYNSLGQLKSNKYGKAYRYRTDYRVSGKKIKTYVHKYNAYGKGKRIK